MLFRERSVLEEAERNITALRILELKQNPSTGKMEFKYLKKLHKKSLGIFTIGLEKSGM